MQNLFGFIGILSVIVYVVSTVMIYVHLKNKGEKVSFLWLRFFMISYAEKYKKLTKDETGEIGYLFYIWLISINAALICAILALFIFKS